MTTNQVKIIISLSFFRAAFFQGQVEQPVRGLISLITHQDIAVLVAINATGVYVIDECECVSIYRQYVGKPHTTEFSYWVVNLRNAKCQLCPGKKFR